MGCEAGLYTMVATLCQRESMEMVAFTLQAVFAILINNQIVTTYHSKEEQMRATKVVGNFISTLGIISAFAFCMTAAPAAASEENSFDVYATVENFTWKEFNTTGSQLVKEDGTLGGIGFTYHGILGEKGAALTIQPRVELLWGTVDYNGQACTSSGTCEAYTDKTGYFGGKFELDLGGKFGTTVAVEPFGGIGAKSWWRDLKDGWTLSGQPVRGYTEHWLTVYGRLGLRSEIKLSENSKIFIEAVAKLPISNDNTAYLTDAGYADDPTLHPGKKTSYAAEAGVKFHVLKVSVFYDSMRFKQSDTVYFFDPMAGGVVSIYQPRSEADMYGVKVGASF